MKKLFSLLACGVLAFSAAPIASSFAKASAEEEAPAAVNLFAEEGSWRHNRSGSLNADCIVFENGEMSLTPRSTIGSTYVGKAMGQGRISFTYQITPNEYYDMTTADGREEYAENIQAANVFFGVTFLNSPRGVKPSGTLAIPFNEGAGGFPYMVAFDTEKQNNGHDPVRAKQLGLTVRRYKYGGSHDYTRWSSVEPSDATYINSNGDEYESKIPDFNKPVGLDKCFDTQKHTVDIDVSNLYKEKGDAVDAVQIEVYFDGELSLRVIDEMPFETDAGPEEMLDKRTRDGYISIYAHGGTQDTAAEEAEEYSVTFQSFSAIFRESNGGTGEAGGKGCSSQTAATGVAAMAGLFAVGCVITFCVAGKKRSQK